VYGSKSFSVYSAIFSVILSGNVWIPVTPGIPTERLLAMMNVLMPDVILLEKDLPENIHTFAEKHEIAIWKLEDMLKHGKGKDFSELDFSPSDWAYIMFTSGSTGVPKGVPMTHHNYINFVRNALEVLPFSNHEVFSDYHDFAFDISIFYLFCAPLTKSAIAPIRKKEERMFPLNHIQKNNITVWSSVPSAISCLRRFRPNEQLENNIKIMFLCGEPFSLDILRYCHECLNVKHVYNFYGLTETGVENFYHECASQDFDRYKEKGFVPIGQPLKGNDFRLTEDKELLLGGCQITPGYLEGAGKERFEEIDGKHWYHTGDIIEFYKGVYFCKGRMDSQVKISGHRIELMDIEVHVRQYEGIKEAVCFIEHEKPVSRIVCVVETAKSRELFLSGVNQWLKERLPEYMIPRKFYTVSQMPINTNGKIDRKAVKQMFSKNILANLRSVS
jgi:acyl-coenzyme A synthetase/AMP-(fatty) acid ligase